VNGQEWIVCDRCGHLEAQQVAENEKWHCDVCGSDAAWLFATFTKARDHSADIRAKASRDTAF